MLDHLADYPWSSYRFNGQGMANELLTPHPEYVAPGASSEAGCRNCRALFRIHVEPGLLDEIRQATNGNLVPGNERFSRENAEMLQRRVTPNRAGRPPANEQ
jgi:putative transposase